MAGRRTSSDFQTPEAEVTGGRWFSKQDPVFPTKCQIIKSFLLTIFYCIETKVQSKVFLKCFTVTRRVIWARVIVNAM